MDTKFYEDYFKDFFVNISIINVKYNTGVELNEKQKAMCKNLEIIVPIFTRLNKNNMVTLDDIIDGNIEGNNNENLENNQNNESKITSFTYNSSNYNSNIQEQKEEEEETSSDEEGDLIVENISLKALESLGNVRENARYKIHDYYEESDSDSDYDSDDSSSQSNHDDNNNYNNDNRKEFHNFIDTDSFENGSDADDEDNMDICVDVNFEYPNETNYPSYNHVFI